MYFSQMELTLGYLFFRFCQTYRALLSNELDECCRPCIYFLEHLSLLNCYEVRHTFATYEPFSCSQVVNSVLPISANEHGDRET